MKQSVVRRSGANVIAIALILLCALAFAPLSEARAQDAGGNLTSAQTGAAQLTAAGEGVAAQATSSVASYKGVRISKKALVEGGEWSGWTSGSTVGDVNGAGLSALSLKLVGRKAMPDLTGQIAYRVYEQGKGWSALAANGAQTQAVSGIEAVTVKLTGNVAANYDVVYRAYMSGSGWRPWVRNNATAGLVKRGQRVLALQVKLTPKTEQAFGVTTGDPGIVYQARTVANGWQAWKHDGATMGSKRLKLAGLAIKADTGTLTGGVKYQVYSSKSGWTKFVSNDAYAAAANKHLEAFKVRLTGEMAKAYDVYYRAYVQGAGWMEWAKNGGAAGSTGYGLYCQAFQVKLVKKGEPAPGQTRYATLNKMEKTLMMNGVDISSWQAGIDLANTQGDFVIIKATGGVGYVNPYYAEWANAALACGKQLGFYHFAREASSPGKAVQEATHFVNAVRPYIGKAVLALDFEAGALDMPNAAKWAKVFMDTVYKQTGVKPLVYMSQSVTWQFDWSAVSKRYKLWVAQYLYRNFYTGYLDNPEGGTDLGYWSKAQIYQYSSTGGVSGYDGYLDLNKFYGSVRTWKQLAQKS